VVYSASGVLQASRGIAPARMSHGQIAHRRYRYPGETRPPETPRAGFPAAGRPQSDRARTGDRRQREREDPLQSILAVRTLPLYDAVADGEPCGRSRALCSPDSLLCLAAADAAEVICPELDCPGQSDHPDGQIVDPVPEPLRTERQGIDPSAASSDPDRLRPRPRSA